MEKQDHNVNNVRKYAVVLKLFFFEKYPFGCGRLIQEFVCNRPFLDSDSMLIDCHILQRICRTLIFTLLNFSLHSLTRNKN